jgi:hypothetical protein
MRASGGAGGGAGGNLGSAPGGTGSSGMGGAGLRPNTLSGFQSLTPPMLTPLDPAANNAVMPAPPAGWKWYPIESTFCRDGSPNGLYVRFTSSDKLLFYLEGGGACSNAAFCAFNPSNLDEVLTGTGETVLGTAGAVGPGRQQPGVYTGNVLSGVFDTSKAENPFKDWNMVYVPYCTGDVHFGTNEDGSVPGTSPAPVTHQKFVGYRNMQQFVGHIVPTFKPKVNRVVISGASAGSFGAALNYSMVQDAFGDVVVDALLDSGVPFTDKYMPVCMQKRWRETWGFAPALPPDCEECNQADGGNMIGLSDFLIRKHPNAWLAAVTGIEDEVMRLFFSVGVKDCSTYDTVDPVAITLGQVLDPSVLFSAADYKAGLLEIRERLKTTSRFSTYYMGAPNNLVHQHVFRARFYQAAAGGKTIAQYVADWLGDQSQTVGP